MSDNQYELPDQFTRESCGGGISLARGWYSIPRLVIPLFVIVLLFVQDDHPFDYWPVLLLVAYFLAVVLLNKTTIFIDSAQLRIVHRPIFFPFRRNRQWFMNSIEKISVILVSRGKRDAASGTTKRIGFAYVVRLRTLNGKDFELQRFSGEDDARYLKQEIMRYVAPRPS